MKNFIQPGDSITWLVAGANVLSGDMVVVGSAFGVAATSALIGQETELKTTGVFNLTKLAGTAWNFGDLIYWDAAAKKATKVASTNVPIGYAVGGGALSAAITGWVRLVQGINPLA